jgi:branched-chain amino acid transport system ATP-binding protein
VALEVREIDVSYGQKQVIQQATLRVEPGSIVALVGHNGAGKTTLLKAIMGLLPLQRGEVRYDGLSGRRHSPADIIRAGVSYCAQGGEVFRTLSVDENLDLAAYHLSDRARERANRETVFDLFPVLLERRKAQAGVLSGGERQQLAIAMALMTSPRVLLLDEPSGGLAPMLVEKVFQSIQRINREYDVAILLVEQNLHQAFGIAQQVYVLRSGKIAYSGPTEELERDDSMRQAILGF